MHGTGHLRAGFKNYTIMKLKAILLAAVAVMTLSCGRHDVYIDKADPENEEEIYQIVHNDVISSSFRITELAEVFSIYQGVRSNRELALSHVEKYFGTTNSVYYEYMSVYEWGTINLLEDGTYTATPSNWRNYWIALKTPREVHIEMPQEHQYVAASTSEDVTWNIEAAVKDSRTITISELDFKAGTDRYGTVEAELTEPMEMPMCRNGQRKLEPTSGRVKITYQAESFTKTFEVEFHEDGKTFFLQGNKTLEVGPEPAYRNEY